MHFDSPTHEPALTRRSRRQSTLPAGGESAVTPAADETPVAPLTRRAARAQMGIAASVLAVAAENQTQPPVSAAHDSGREAVAPRASVTPPPTSPSQAQPDSAQAPFDSVQAQSGPVQIDAPKTASPASMVAMATPPAPIAAEEPVVRVPASEPAPTTLPQKVVTPAASGGSRGTSEDEFAAAMRALGSTASDRPKAASVAEEVSIARPVTESIPVARRGRSLRRAATIGFSASVMGVAGLIAVSMTLPTQALAVAQGGGASAATSLVVSGSGEQTAADDDEIQAFIAAGDVQNVTLQGAQGFSSISRADLAAEQGIRFSESLYVNDPTAKIQWPYVVGVAMSSPYGMRDGVMHQGIDLVPGDGAPIQSIADGVVRLATESDGGYGVGVYIDHVIDGQVITSHYAHMQYGSLRVKTGDEVKVGTILGKTGNTGRSFGAHLHFELLVNGSPIDPLPWMQENAGRH